jgi:hypothetical protein
LQIPSGGTLARWAAWNSYCSRQKLFAVPRAQPLPSEKSALAGCAGRRGRLHHGQNPAEIQYGIQVLPPGKRRMRLAEAIDKMFAEEFQLTARPWPPEMPLTSSAAAFE